MIASWYTLEHIRAYVWRHILMNGALVWGTSKCSRSKPEALDCDGGLPSFFAERIPRNGKRLSCRLLCQSPSVNQRLLDVERALFVLCQTSCEHSCARPDIRARSAVDSSASVWYLGVALPIGLQFARQLWVLQHKKWHFFLSAGAWPNYEETRKKTIAQNVASQGLFPCDVYESLFLKAKSSGRLVNIYPHCSFGVLPPHLPLCQNGIHRKAAYRREELLVVIRACNCNSPSSSTVSWDHG